MRYYFSKLAVKFKNNLSYYLCSQCVPGYYSRISCCCDGRLLPYLTGFAGYFFCYFLIFLQLVPETPIKTTSEIPPVVLSVPAGPPPERPRALLTSVNVGLDMEVLLLTTAAVWIVIFINFFKTNLFLFEKFILWNL